MLIDYQSFLSIEWFDLVCILQCLLCVTFNCEHISLTVKFVYVVGIMHIVILHVDSYY